MLRNEIRNAIRTLKIRKSFCADINIDAIMAYSLAIEALEKQKPKKPSVVGMQNKCPNIDCFESVLGCYTHCSGCGQKIDWNKD